MARKWYSFTTLFRSLKEEMRKYLMGKGIKFELSDGRTWADAPMMWHFEIYASESEVSMINDWLDSVCITERNYREPV